MGILNLNKIKKISLLLFIVQFLFSCQEKRNCSNAQLSNTITILGLGDLSKKSVKFYSLKANKETLKRIKINTIFFQNNETLSGYGESIITLEKSLFSKENYRLVVNYKNYDISDIKVLSEVE